MRQFSWTIYLLLCCSVNFISTHYVDHRSDFHNIDSSAVVFPSVLNSPFNTPNRVHNSDDLHLEYLHAVEAIFAVTTRLKVFLGRDANKNVLVSPISTTTALGQILLGARGESRRQLLDMLTTVNRTSGTAEATVVEFHQQLGGLIKLLQNSPDYDESYQLELASAMFLNPRLHLHKDFISAISDLYDVDIEPMDFTGSPVDSMKAINLWASRHTKGTIETVLTAPLPKTTAVVLTNAIYFKGDWEVPFDARYTIPGKFKSNQTHEVTVDYMRGEFELMYVNSTRLGCIMIAIPYKHAKAAMYVILPDIESQYNIQSFAANLSISEVRELISSMKQTTVTLVMPKMTLTQSFSMKKALSEFRRQVETELYEKDNISGSHRNKKLLPDHPVRLCKGVECPETREMSCNSSAQLELLNNERSTKKNFSDNGLDFDLSGASPDSNFRVDDIIQHIFLEVNEIGTVASAVSASTVEKIGNYRNFVMNRPFVFFIRQEVTRSPLFWGTIVDPTSGNVA